MAHVCVHSRVNAAPALTGGAIKTMTMTALILARDVLRDCLHLRWTQDLPEGDWDYWPLPPIGPAYENADDFNSIDDDDRHDFLNQNWEEAACLDCGAIVSVCEYCGSAYHVHRHEAEWNGYHGASSGVPLCGYNDEERGLSFGCMRCVRCCPNVGREFPLDQADIREAIERFVKTTRHHYIKVPSKKPPQEWAAKYHGEREMDATRYSAEEKIVAATSEAEAVDWLLNDPHVFGGGRRGDYLDWLPRGREVREFEVDDKGRGKRKKKRREPAGLYVDFNHHRGRIDPLQIVRAIRNAPRETYVCLGCGGEFTSMFADCPFWKCWEVTRKNHGQDAEADDFGVMQIGGADDRPRVITSAAQFFEPDEPIKPAVKPEPPSKGGQWSLF